MKIILHTGAAERDVTEHVKLLYDLTVSSMNWGSGFLDLEEMLRVLQFGAAIGTADLDAVSDAAGLEKEYREHVEPPPGRSTAHYLTSEGRAYLQEWSAWNDRRGEWVKAETARRFGNPPTWESIQDALDRAGRKFDEVDQ